MNYPNREKLLLEMEEWRRRAEEAEDTLRAIREGEVDALVVSAKGEEKIFTLKSAEAKIVSYVRKLEFSNLELENFAFIASHDLQEPLRKLQVFGDLLIQKAQLDEEDC